MHETRGVFTCRLYRLLQTHGLGRPAAASTLVLQTVASYLNKDEKLQHVLPELVESTFISFIQACNMAGTAAGVCATQILTMIEPTC